MFNKPISIVTKFIPWGIGAGLLLLFGTLSFAALSNRTFLVDGSFWFFNIINYHNPFVDTNYVRWFNYVLQYPAVAYLKYFSDTDSTVQAVRILSFTHSLFPFVSLALSAAILHSRGRRDLMLFPLLSFGLATLSTVAFSVGSVPNALSVFWPLYCLFLTRNISSTLHFLTVIVLSCILAVTYEAVFLFFTLILAILLFQFDDFKKSKIKSTILALCFIGIITYLLYRAFGPAAGSKEGFKASLSAGLNIFQKYSVVVLFGVSAAMWPFLQKADRKWDKFFAFLMPTATLAVTGLLIFRILQDRTIAPVWDAFNSRVTAIPVAIWVAFLMFVFYYKEKLNFKIAFSGLYLKSLGLSVVIVLFGAGFYDYQITTQSNHGERYLRSVVETQTGCIKLLRKDYIQYFAAYGFADWSLPYSSLLLSGKKNVDTVVFTEKEEGSFEKFDPCVVSNGKLKNDFDFEIPVGPNQIHFDYQKLLQGQQTN